MLLLIVLILILSSTSLSLANDIDSSTTIGDSNKISFKEKLITFSDNIDMVLLLSIGIGLMSTMVFMLLVYTFSNIGKSQFKYLNDLEGPINKYKRKLKRKLNNQKKIILNKKEKYLVIIGAILLGTTTTNWRNIPKYGAFGILVTLVIVILFQKIRNKNIHTRKVKEVAIVFEAIELYMKAGYSMYQAIRTSRFLVTEIRPAIDLCLTHWSAGPKVALTKLQEELNLPEAETLILMLINLENSGSQDMRSAIGGEVFNIENIQKMKANISISNKPLVLMLYRMLPLASVMGITVGSLVYRTFMMLQTTLGVKIL